MSSLGTAVDDVVPEVYSTAVCSRCARAFPSAAVTGDVANDQRLCEPCRGAVFIAEHER